MSERAPSLSGLYARAALGLVPGATWLRGAGGRDAAGTAGEPGEGTRATTAGEPGGEGLTLTLDGVRVDRDQLARYARVVGARLSDRLPPAYPHVLAFPLQLALITGPGSPLGAAGLVHIYDRIVQHRPLDAGEELSLRVHATRLRPHRRGRQFDLVIEVRAGGELVWEEVSTNLRLGRGEESAPGPSVPSARDLEASACWRLRGDLGRRYAAVSGDFNPIHLHPLSARLLGFPTAIAHGMWTLARCLAALEPLVPDACEIEAAFKRPIALPAAVELAERREPSGELRFGVRGRDAAPHLDGVLRAHSWSPSWSR